MKPSTRRIIVFILLLGIVMFNSCKKDKFDRELTFTDESRFFLLPSTTDPIMNRIATELKLQKEKNPKLIETIIKRNGYPIWEKALFSKQGFIQRSMTSGEDTIVYIPLAVQGNDEVTAFFLATINNYIELQLYNKFEYEQFQFDTLGTNNANRLALQFMVLDFVAFGHKNFVIHDKRLLKDFEIALDAPVSDRIIHIDYPKENFGGRGWEVWEFEYCTTTRFLNCSSETNCCRIAGVAPGTCSACETCWETKKTCKKISKLVFYDDGYNPPTGVGGNGGGGGGSIPGSSNTVQLCNPTPLIQNGLPPCPKGLTLGWEPILLESFVSSFYNTLNNSQKAWWDNLNNYPIKNSLLTFLYSNNFTVQSESLVKDLIDWLIADNNISIDDIEYYLTLPETGDGSYDQIFWENPNTIFQQITLPTLQQFTENFPKRIVSGGITFMPSNQVYQMVGGDLGDKYGQPNYINACAIRASWAFNTIQVSGTYPFKINPGTGTEYGANNLSYIVNAKAFNAYMHKRFGNPSHSFNAAQINSSRSNLNNFLKNLRSQNIHGIYTLVNSSGSYTGHIDLLTFGECLGGYSLPENITAIEKIEIWQLD